MSADSDLVLRNLLDACDRGRPLSDIHDRLRVEVGRLGCPECGGTGARGCGAAWHDGKPDAPSPLDEPSELIDVAASHSRWLRHNGYVQPADCMDRLCELLVLVTGRLTGEPTAAPTRPTREQLAEVLGKALDCWNGAGEEEGALEWYLAGNLTPLLAGEGTPERERAEAEQEAIRDAGSWEEQRTLLAGATPYVAGEGTAQPDPCAATSDPTITPPRNSWHCERGRRIGNSDAAEPWAGVDMGECPRCYGTGMAPEAIRRLASGEGTAPQPSTALDALVSELREAVAAYEGKAVGGPDGWQDPHDAEQYLAGSVDRLLDEIDRLRDTANRANASARRRGEERDALRAMVDGCREIVAEHEGKVDGDRPIDDIAAVVGYPERGTASQPGTVTATYTNWQNETAERHFIPVSLWWGVTEWHPRSGWHLDAFDVDRRAMRSFALSGFDRNVIPLAQRGTAPQVPAEVLGYADAAALRHHIHALLTRVDRWVESVEGTPAPWALVGDMADVLRRVLVWAHSPGVNPDGWHYRYLIAAGGDTEQLWAIQPTGSENPRHRVVPCLIRASDLDEVDDEEATPDPSRRVVAADGAPQPEADDRG